MCIKPISVPDAMLVRVGTKGMTELSDADR